MPRRRWQGSGTGGVRVQSSAPDLTALSRQNHGKFPRDRMVQAIGENRMQSAHGSTDMPVWGPVFLAQTGENQVEVERRISDLIEHIKSVQVN